VRDTTTTTHKRLQVDAAPQYLLLLLELGAQLPLPRLPVSSSTPVSSSVFGGGGSGSGGGGAVVGSSPVPAAFTPAVGLGLRHASMPWRGVDGLEACNRICIRAGDHMRMCMAQQHRCVHTCTVPYLERHASVRDVTGVVEGV